jgi:hypothetical protein
MNIVAFLEETPLAWNIWFPNEHMFGSKSETLPFEPFRINLAFDLCIMQLNFVWRQASRVQHKPSFA